MVSLYGIILTVRAKVGMIQQNYILDEVNRPISSCTDLTQNLLCKAFINLDLNFRQNLFPKLVIAQDNAQFKIQNIYSIF